MKKYKAYISGPISGRRREDYLRDFAERERWLRQGMHDSDGTKAKVVNPCRLAPCRFPWLYKVIGYRLTLLYDLYHLMRCTHITMLPGWQQSRGARLEKATADIFGIKEI